MATTAKLYFFDARGRSELIKLLLAAGQVAYENVHFDWNTWPDFQKNMPFGKCPMLEIDGKKIGQTTSIVLYLAEKCGLNGSTIDERLIVNQAVLFREEVMLEQLKRWRVEDPVLLAEKTKYLYDEAYPRYLKIFTQLIKENSQGKSFVLGDKFSAADCAIFAATTSLQQERPDVLAQFPEVEALRKRVAEVDGIKQYLQSRPYHDL